MRFLLFDSDGILISLEEEQVATGVKLITLYIFHCLKKIKLKEQICHKQIYCSACTCIQSNS